MDNIKIHIESSEDRSVGIFAMTATVEMPQPSDDEDRERIRGILSEAFNGIFDGVRQVWFDDECYECLGRNGTHKGTCMADPANWPDDD
jgi:hypothetical protein